VSIELAKKLRHLEQMLFNSSVDVRTRSQHTTYTVCECGLDAAPALEKLIKKADQVDELKEKVKQEAASPRSPEFFLGHFQCDGQTYAAVTGVPNDVYLCCKKNDVNGLKVGDSVLVDSKNARIVGRNGAVPHHCGDIAEVVRVPSEDTRGVFVKHHEQEVFTRVAARIHSPDNPLKVGSRVVFDPTRRMAFDRIEQESDGTELLTTVRVLDKVNRADVGAIHPVADEILFRAKRNILHPEWTSKMGAREATSYLFTGPTGTGKSLTLTLIAREITDFVGGLMDERVSRLVTVDASTFYSPLFGQTEANIKSFFRRVRQLGKRPLRAKDGRVLRVTLLIALEEAEALLRARGEFGGSAHLFDRPLALLLQEISSVGSELDIPVVFAASSNRSDLIDPAGLRRFGMRVVRFGTLTAAQAASVLDKKIPAGRPLRNVKDGSSHEEARLATINQAIDYLYGNQQDQGIAEVRMQDGERRILRRRDLVTGAQLEEAVSRATDECLLQSDQADELLGLDADAIIHALQSQYANLATLLRPHNLPEHCPDWFAGEPLRVESVRPLVHGARRPQSLLVR